jgi:hypothetical protein
MRAGDARRSGASRSGASRRRRSSSTHRTDLQRELAELDMETREAGTGDIPADPSDMHSHVATIARRRSDRVAALEAVAATAGRRRRRHEIISDDTTDAAAHEGSDTMGDEDRDFDPGDSDDAAETARFRELAEEPPRRRARH